MFCKKCGSQLGAGETFCGCCGAKNDGVAYQENADAQTSLQSTPKLTKEALLEKINSLGKSKIIYFLAIGTVLLSMIFSMPPVFRITSMYMVSEEFMIHGFFGVVDIITYIGALVLMILPLFIGKELKPIFFLAAKIITIVNFIWFFFLLFTAMGSVNERGLSSVATVAPSVTGWFFILTTAAAIFLLYKFTYDWNKLHGVAPVAKDFSKFDKLE